MSYSHSIPPVVQTRRAQLVGLVVLVAALAVAVTSALAAFAFDSGTSKVSSNAETFRLPASAIIGLGSLYPSYTGSNTSSATSTMSMTPWQLSGAGLGTGYQIPSAESSPTVASVLASMSPQSRRYTEKVMNLTFEQLAAGGAGYP